MIRTKTAQVIDARTNKSEVVYFHLMDEVKNEASQTVTFYIATSYLNAENQFQQFGEISKATYAKSTFMTLFGEMSINEFEAAKDTLMIGQIDYINKYEPTGEEKFPFSKFWALTAEDLEIV